MGLARQYPLTSIKELVEYYNITSYGTTSIKKDGTYLKALTHDVY